MLYKIIHLDTRKHPLNNAQSSTDLNLTYLGAFNGFSIL